MGRQERARAIGTVPNDDGRGVASHERRVGRGQCRRQCGPCHRVDDGRHIGTGDSSRGSDCGSACCTGSHCRGGHLIVH
jgi:hypothetical protein